MFINLFLKTKYIWFSTKTEEFDKETKEMNKQMEA